MYDAQLWGLCWMGVDIAWDTEKIKKRQSFLDHKRSRSRGVKTKPPAAWLGGADSISTILELMALNHRTSLGKNEERCFERICIGY